MRPAIPAKLTYADYLEFPDDGRRHELIEGAHYVTPSPVTRHQRILGRLAHSIQTWLEAHRGGEVFFAPVDVVLSDVDVVVPDLIYVSPERAGWVQARGVFGAPDLVVEILSPGTRARDVGAKRALYERAGVHEYWTIDPTADGVTVYRRAADRFGPPIELTKAGGDSLTTELLAGFSLSLAKLLE